MLKLLAKMLKLFTALTSTLFTAFYIIILIVQ